MPFHISLLRSVFIKSFKLSSSFPRLEQQIMAFTIMVELYFVATRNTQSLYLIRVHTCEACLRQLDSQCSVSATSLRLTEAASRVLLFFFEKNLGKLSLIRKFPLLVHTQSSFVTSFLATLLFTIPLQRI